MSEVVDYLREQFARLHAHLDRSDRTLGEIVSRLGRLERSAADVQVQLAEFSIRLDGVGERLDRIERRLELVDAGAPP